MLAHVEYIKLFMEYEAEDMPVGYFYEVDLDNDRYCHRAIEIFANRQVDLIDDLYCDVIEAVPIPTADEFNSNVWGEGFHASVISKVEFVMIWESGIYSGDLLTT